MTNGSSVTILEEATSSSIKHDFLRHNNNNLSSVALDYCCSGIDFSLAGNGGPDCADYVDPYRRNVEILLGLSVSILALLFGFWLKTPVAFDKIKTNQNPTSHHSSARLFFLCALAFTYGLELCYKLCTRQLVFILNPCHMLCLLQLWLLFVPADTQSSFIAGLFRVHLSQLYLPIVAFVCPVTNTLFLPGEVATYWLEHILLLVIPIYLLFCGGKAFQAEAFFDTSYTFLAYGLFGIYNFGMLQQVALITHANVNSILCPAISDPFSGPNYRLHALWHQLAQAWLGSKIFACIGLLKRICTYCLLGRAKIE